MEQAGSSSSSRTGLRVAAGIIAAGLVGLALFADRLGTGTSGGFGMGQIMLVIAGVGFLTAALLGRRLIPLYKGTALLLLNTVVLLIALELAAAGLLHFLAPGSPQGNANLRYRESLENVSFYDGRTWAEAFWQEHWAVEREQIYQPWVLWHIAPHAGSFVNVNAAGIRNTPGADCAGGALRIFVFGGSAVWGFGAPDDGAIPAHMQAALTESGQHACVTNYGQNGFVSTQDVLELQRAISAGNTPDIAVFYNGYNDISAAALNGHAGAHLYYSRIARRFEGDAPDAARGPGLTDLLRTTRTWALIQRLPRRAPAQQSAAGPGARTAPSDAAVAALADSVVHIYLTNFRTIEALAGAHGFSFHVFWQPLLPLSAKPRTAEEERMGQGLGPILPLAQAVFDRLPAAMPPDRRFHDLRAVFDQDSALAYIDFVHLTPDANRIIASRIIRELKGEGAFEERQE